MDLMGMMGKLKATQDKIEETKKRLDTILVDEQSNDDGLLKVTFTANNKLKAITIEDSLLEDKEQLEDYLVLVINKAIEKAENINKSELEAVTKMDLPMIPGMEDLFK